MTNEKERQQVDAFLLQLRGIQSNFELLANNRKGSPEVRRQAHAMAVQIGNTTLFF
jgi:hypothetical protein